MRLAIMQPYFFPYQGYFQLIASVDRFVVYDDVAFIKNGWINRNRILTAAGAQYFTVPLSGASVFRSVRDTLCAPPSAWRDRLLRTLTQAYARAPERDAGLSLVQSVFGEVNGQSLSDLATASLRAVCAFAEISTPWRESSAAYNNGCLSGVSRVIDICQREGASTYVNAPGGRALYEPAIFEGHGLSLRFLKPQLELYPQSRSADFVPGLSVIDLIMNVPRAEVARRLHSGELSA